MKPLCLFVLDIPGTTRARMLWGKAGASWFPWFLSPVISYFVDMMTTIPLIKYILFLCLSSDFLTASCFNRALISLSCFLLSLQYQTSKGNLPFPRCFSLLQKQCLLPLLVPWTIRVFCFLFHQVSRLLSVFLCSGLVCSYGYEL